MTPGLWRQIEDLYNAVRESSPEARAKLLSDAEPAVRRAVEELLQQPRPVDAPDSMAASSVSSLAPGSELGPYRIEALLGTGGMGQVYRAVDSRLGRRVAIKVSGERFSRRFEREARAIAALNHPNVCTLHDVGPNYLVMELLEGPTLAELICKGPVPLPDAMYIARQIAEALDAAHARGIAHRDLKPANIKVAPDGIVKVLDFGLARVLPAAGTIGEGDPTQSVSLTEPGVIVGTPAYMAPEQALGKAVDKRVDIWAFGVILYEMLTGSRLFAGKTSAEILRTVLTHEPDWKQVPPPAQPLLRRCLERDPQRRLRDIGDARFELEETAIEQRPPSRRAWIAAAMGPVAGGAVVWAVSRFGRARAKGRTLRLQIAPPAGSEFTFGASATGIAISPDGTNAAYVATDHGNAALWVRPLDDVVARRLSGTDGAGMPFWSPDGQSLGFFVKNRLFRIDVSGGVPQLICEGFAFNARGGAWTSDGQILFAPANSGLWQAPATGGQASPFTTLDPAGDEIGHLWPQVLPGGRFLYFVKSKTRQNSGVFVAPLSKPGERVRLLRSETNALFAPAPDGNRRRGYLLWLKGATLVAQSLDLEALQLSGAVHAITHPVSKMGVSGNMHAAVSTTGLLLCNPSAVTRQLTWMDRKGKPQERLGDPGPNAFFRLSPDGRRVVFSRESTEGADLWVLDVDRGVPARFSSRPGTNIDPVWSPDGKEIIFASGPPLQIYRQALGGAAREQPLLPLPNSQIPLDWSRDGHILYEDSADNHISMWILSAGARPESRRPYRQDSYNETGGRISADGRWVAYQSDESGQYEVYVDAFPDPREKVRISTGGGIMPEWSADGRELFYATPDYKLMSVAIGPASAGMQPSAPRELFALPVSDPAMRPFDLSSDGQRILVLDVPEHLTQSLTLIVNWPALMD